MNGEVGEHRTLGGFCPVLHGETVILEESIRDLSETPRGTGESDHEREHAGTSNTQHHRHNPRNATRVLSEILKRGAGGDGLTRIA
jgi:hypothetical protein